MRIIKDGLSAGSDLLSFIFPPLCIVCDGPADQTGDWVCTECMDQLEMIETPVRSGLKSAGDLDEVRAAFVYNDAVRTIVHHLKYSRATRLAVPLAKYMSVLLRDLPEWMTMDCLAPVPLHPVKRRERGYNQSEAIAKALSAETGIAFEPDMLFRNKYTVSQTQMESAAERQKNMREAFSLNPKKEIRGKRIILIDDVVTTGSTANACAQILKEAGAYVVYLLTIAHPVLDN